MKRSPHLLGLLVLASASSAQNAVPGVIVVQIDSKTEIVEAAKKIAGKDGTRPQNLTVRFDAFEFERDLKSIPMESIAAEQVYEDGRLTPIAWALTDPVFRAAVEERQIERPSDSPALPELLAALPKLRAQYIFQVFTFQKGQEIWTLAKLNRGDKEIWKDEVRVWQSQTESQFDEENIKVSIARTWVQFLAGGPLKGLTPRLIATTPAVQPGLRPPAAIVTPPPSQAVVDNKQLLVEAMKLMSAKQFAEAINLLRDAVDAEPADFERRQALIAALTQINEPRLAAEEARRAAHLTPEKVDLWVLAARSWIAAGNGTEAVADLNEAVARDPEGAGTRMLLGELQFDQGRFPLAIDHLSAALKAEPNAFALRLRAFARAATGQVPEFASDLLAAKKVEPAETPEEALRRHRMAKRLTLKLADEVGSELRLSVQRVRMNPKDADLKQSTADLEAKLRGIEACFAEEPAPAQHQSSSDRLGLALKLLLQTIADLRGSFGTLDEDALTEATINLGEAFKALKATRTDFETEIG
ncbi:MAG TPA: tetratricopeptide repeat protein [Fimbriimonadaceae bacterium]|nr:tetratricopeptide repeat protein [Fimbriimonadaceae bacterium]